MCECAYVGMHACMYVCMYDCRGTRSADSFRLSASLLPVSVCSSQNGTWVNGVRVGMGRSVPVEDGDIISLVVPVSRGEDGTYVSLGASQSQAWCKLEFGDGTDIDVTKADGPFVIGRDAAHVDYAVEDSYLSPAGKTGSRVSRSHCNIHVPIASPAGIGAAVSALEACASKDAAEQQETLATLSFDCSDEDDARLEPHVPHRVAALLEVMHHPKAMHGARGLCVCVNPWMNN